MLIFYGRTTMLNITLNGWIAWLVYYSIKKNHNCMYYLEYLSAILYYFLILYHICVSLRLRLYRTTQAGFFSYKKSIMSYIRNTYTGNTYTVQLIWDAWFQYKNARIAVKLEKLNLCWIYYLVDLRSWHHSNGTLFKGKTVNAG